VALTARRHGAFRYLPGQADGAARVGKIGCAARLIEVGRYPDAGVIALYCHVIGMFVRLGVSPT
jgi:hypothetical protein